MITELSEYDLKAAFDLMIEQGTRFPNGVYPAQRNEMSEIKDFSYINTEDKWNAYQWNMSDESASAKPSWSDILRFREEAILPREKRIALARLNHNAKVRIAVNYHSQANEMPQKEWEVRLSGEDVSDKDTERVRLIAVCHALETRIEAATTLEQLEAIDVVSDNIWAPTE